MCKVSVLMPVFNAEKYLAEAIDSIISQSFEDWELVIINDGSTDSSLSIIETYVDKRIRLINNPQNIGLIKTLNNGINLCHGEYIARMDADDISHPERLQQQVNFLEQNNNHILCGTNATVINNKGECTGKIVNPSDNIYLQINLLFTNPFIHPSVMLRKSALVNTLFNEKAIHIEDYELWTRLAQTGQVANLRQALLQYRWHDTNVSVEHAQTQEIAKNEIIRSQLLKFGIEATPKQLQLHRLTFQLYNLGNKTINPLEDPFSEVNDWFALLKKQNRLLKVYPTTSFEAFLWSRWIVLCISQKKHWKALKPDFITLSPSIIIEILQLILYLRKK